MSVVCYTFDINTKSNEELTRKIAHLARICWMAKV